MRLRAAILLAALLATPAHAQISGEAFAGFSGSSKSPIQIDADALEVIDGENRAVFSGNVRVQQGDSVIETSQLEVVYAKGGSNAEGSTPGNISMLNLSGGVIARSGANTAQGEKGSFDVAREIVTLSGDVTLSQGRNVAKGCKLVAELKTNEAKLSRCPGQRVRTVITPGSN